MNRAMALLAGLLLVSQVAAQPVAAAGGQVGPSVLAQEERAPGSPRTPSNFPDRPDSLSAGPMADLKVELVAGVWQGNQRHSTFRVSNIGNHVAKNVAVRKWTDIADFGSDEDQEYSYMDLGDMAPGAVLLFNVVCVPPVPEDTCVRNGAKALSISSDKNPANDWAKDEV